MSEENNALLAKLNEMETHYDHIEQQMSDPKVISDPAKLIKLSKEQGKLKDLVSKYRQYKKILMHLNETQAMINDNSTDAEMKKLAEEEVQELEKQRDILFTNIQNSLLTADDDVIDSIIMELRAGTGGEEAALFVRDLYNMYNRYAENRKWKAELLDFSPTDRGGFREVILSIKGNGVWSDLKYEAGGHRVQRVPETETQGRIHTSAATVAVLPEREEIDINIAPGDVVEHVSRAGGPGGQNVNKVSSAIRLEHIPTGITVNMREDKSQHKNRAKAWRLLRSRLYDHYERQKRSERDSQRKSMIGSGDRSEKVRTYNFPQNRLTDHRINLSLYSLDKILFGDIGAVIEALKENDIKERLKNLKLV